MNLNLCMRTSSCWNRKRLSPKCTHTQYSLNFTVCSDIAMSHNLKKDQTIINSSCLEVYQYTQVHTVHQYEGTCWLISDKIVEQFCHVHNAASPNMQSFWTEQFDVFKSYFSHFIFLQCLLYLCSFPVKFTVKNVLYLLLLTSLFI